MDPLSTGAKPFGWLALGIRKKLIYFGSKAQSLRPLTETILMVCT